MIEIQDLSFAYRKKENLFNQLQLSLAPGNVYGLLGKNGAGKTTLLKVIAGLLFPQTGTCEVLGYSPQKRLPQMLEEIFFIPEEFYTPPITLKLYEELYAPFYPRFDHARMADYLKDFGITRSEKLTSLSYGQKKKFLLAFGLATDCKLLILDEPTNGLDIPTKSLFRRILASSMTDERSFIISTHQVRDMENLIDPIIILDEGQVIFNHSALEVSERLSIRLEQDEPAAGEALFWERTLGGYAVIYQKSDDGENKIDLEILFNAVINNKEKIGKIFGEEAGYANG